MAKNFYLPVLLFFIFFGTRVFSQSAKSYYIPDSQYNRSSFYMPDPHSGKPTLMTRLISYTQSSKGYQIEDSNFFQDQFVSSKTKTIVFTDKRVEILDLATSSRMSQDKYQVFDPSQTLFVIPDADKTASWINTIDDQQSVKYTSTWTTVSINGSQKKAVKVTHKSPYYQTYTIEYYVKGIGLWKQENQSGGKIQIFSKFQSLSLDENALEIVEVKEAKIEPKKALKEEVFTVVEQQAQFPGGEAEMHKFIKESMKYPAAAQRANIQGKVFLSFIVRSTGDIEKIEVQKGLGFGCDEEAMRVIKSMPRWSPGKQSGRAVSSTFHLPIIFSLD